MPDTNEFHVWASVVETVEASTTMVNLTGSSNPLRTWGDIGSVTRPICAGRFGQGRYLAGSCDPVGIPLVIDTFVESDSTGLASAIADELEQIITYTNLASTVRTHPVDVAPTLRARFPQPELDEGRNRLTLEWDLRHHR